MADFVDLGKIFMTAEAIKGARRQSNFDTLREQALRQNLDTGKAAEERAATQYSQEQKLYGTRMLNVAAKAIAADPAAVADWGPELEKAGIKVDFAKVPPEQLQEQAGVLAKRTDLVLDAFMKQDPKFAQLDQNHRLQLDEIGVTHKNRLAEIAATGAESRKTASLKPGRAFRAMSPEEIKAAGLPAGSSAQIDDSTGKIDVLSKRDTTASLSQKDATTAKMKLNTVKLARMQLNRIRDQFEGAVDQKTGKRDPKTGIKGTFAAGPGSGAMVLSEPAQKFDAAVGQMRSTLTALTRVPGVGAMSDYETKLDQEKFPSRSKMEGTTQQQIDDLDNMLNAIETGYSDLLSGGNAASQPAQSAAEDPLGIR